MRSTPCTRARYFAAASRERLIPWLIVISVAGGCDEPEDPGAHGTGSEERTPEAASGGPGAPHETADQPRTPSRVRFDLVRHLERAERFLGETRWLPLGEPSGQQYTLGGWRTRSGRVGNIDGVNASLIDNVTGIFLLPIDSPLRCRISLRARAFGDGRLTIYVDDETIGHTRLPTDGSWGIAHATIPESQCTVGEHDLRLRVVRTGVAPGHGEVGVAVDWIQVGAEDAPIAEVVSVAATHNDAPSLRMGNRLRLAYTFEVPEGASLELRTHGSGTLHARLARDLIEPVDLGQARGTLSVFDLEAYAGQLIRVELTADGPLTLSRAAVVTHDLRPVLRGGSETWSST